MYDYLKKELGAKMPVVGTSIHNGGLSGYPLLTAGARTGNTIMRWNEKRTSLVEVGTGPILIEPVTGTITLLNIDDAKRVDVFPLDGAGRHLGPVINASRRPSSGLFPIGQHVTPWYLVSVVR